MPDIAMFISKTPHVMAIYAAAGAFFIGFPLTPWWARLVEWLDGRARAGRRFPALVVVAAAVIAHVTVLIMHAFQFNAENSRISFEVFAAFSFFFMPVTLPLVAEAIPHARAGGARLGTLLAYLFALGGFGSAATNIHDVIWCWRATGGYITERLAGTDLDFWMNLLNTGTKDYRIFGFYMVVQIVIALGASHVALWRLARLGRMRFSRRFSSVCWAGMAAMAFGITILDWPNTFASHFNNSLAVSAGLVVSALVFYAAGGAAEFAEGGEE